MRNKIIFLSLIIFFASDTFSFCQNLQNGIESRVLNEIASNQKYYFKNKIDETHKKFYVSIINISPTLRPSVIKRIKQIDASFDITRKFDLNMLEGYDPSHPNIYGLIWQDSIYFRYVYRPLMDTIFIEKIKKQGLNDEEKTIVDNFDNWESQIFKNWSTSGRTEPLYYFASKLRYYSGTRIRSIAFCF